MGCELMAEKGSCAADSVLPFSTGVIGEPLNMPAFERGIPAALENLSADNWARAAKGIMTTDTLPKGFSKQADIAGSTVTVTGISKGAGMIMPNMATMLGFIATDAGVAADVLQAWCKELADCSFNHITIDGDTSTNDSCMLMATGKSGVMITDAASAEGQQVFALLKEAFQILAQAIVRDGEGATKFVTIRVESAAAQKEALDVAYTVAHSPLVKTALFASDPNWGRILAAVGRAADDYSEARGQAVMDREEITIAIDLKRGEVRETV